ncbi:hypothetical protein ABZ477_17590 [Microbacterium sp. NPDC019599]|uniref:hypothetical protein n=1 Tax=Microbacterium sp. NPDC019599 TaxID=3154690 RepID=UPI0033E5F144
MGWKVRAENATGANGYQAVNVDVVIGEQRISLAPGASGTLSESGSGRLTLNAHCTNRLGVASASTDINVLGDFSDFACKVTLPSGSALRLTVTAQ